MARREIFKELLHKSSTSLDGFNKYVAMGNLATLLNGEGKWQEALATYQECIDYFGNIGEEGKQNLAVYISGQAQIYQDRGDYEQALALENKALRIYIEIKNAEHITGTHFRIAQLLRRMQRWQDAYDTGELGLTEAKSIRNHELTAQFLHGQGLTLIELNREKEALACFQESLQIRKRILDREGQADTLGEIGKILSKTGQFKAAINVFQESIEFFYELNVPKKVAIILESIGITLEQQGYFREALEKYQEALRLKLEYSSPQGIALTEKNIARVKAKLEQ